MLLELLPVKKNKVILFYSHVKDVALFDDVSFYEQDIRALREMGFDVVVSNKVKDFFTVKYDLVYIWWWSRAIIPIILRPFKRSKVCIAGAFHYSTPLMDGTDYVRRSWLYKKVVNYCLRNADGNIFVSNYEMKDVVKNLKVNNPHLVHHGIDIKKYHPEKKCKSDGRKKILTITWLEENNLKRKCIYQALLAFDDMVKKGFDLEYYLAGRNGPGAEHLKTFIEKLESSDRIFLLGHISESEKIKLLQSVDIFLTPTLYEGFGVAIAEALACGTPVITSDNGAVGEVAGSCALYADPHDPFDISNKILNVLENQELSERLQVESAERIKEKFSYEAHYLALKKAVNNIF